MTSRIEAFYDSDPGYEWERLDRHPVELPITLRALKEYLPAPPARVIDIGASVGRYAIELTRWGYSVTLVDISARCLEFASARAAEASVSFAGAVRADARDLGRFHDGSFDAALVMGPLYHLLEHEERLACLREARRVLRPEGLVFASFIHRYGVLQYGLVSRPAYIRDCREEWEEICRTGVYRPEKHQVGFTDAWFARTDEIEPLMAEGGFRKIALLAAEPLSTEREEQLQRIPGDLWDAWMDELYRIAKDPSILGSAAHPLYMGRKASP